MRLSSKRKKGKGKQLNSQQALPVEQNGQVSPSVDADELPDNESEFDEDELTLIRDEMVAKRVTAKTRKSYESTFRWITRICKERIPGSCDRNGSLKLPMRSAHLQAFLKIASEPVNNEGAIRAYSSVQQYVSVIKFFYEEQGKTMKTHVIEYLTKWLAGYKRDVATLKEKGIMKNYEGKLPINVKEYERLTQLALWASEIRGKASSYVHLFLILCWNIYARSNTVTSLGYHHLSWGTDSLVVDMSKQKADQSGNMYYYYSCSIILLLKKCIIHRRKGDPKECLCQSILSLAVSNSCAGSARLRHLLSRRSSRIQQSIPN
jgi:hypothetical protein